MTTLTEYRQALALSRRVRMLPPAIGPAAALAFARSEPAIAPNQKEAEILWLLDELADLQPRVVLEVGTDRGGTLFLWTRVADPGALLVSLDIRKMVGRLGRYSPFAVVRKSFERDSQRVELIDAVDSHEAGTVDRVRAVLGGRPVDFLFIDGDHRYEAVSRDFELYAPLVRPDGIIALHDISPSTTPDTEGTARFWAELKRDHPTDERIAGGAAGYGIGIYRKPR